MLKFIYLPGERAAETCSKTIRITRDLSLQRVFPLKVFTFVDVTPYFLGVGSVDQAQIERHPQRNNGFH